MSDRIERLSEELARRGLRLATAESCTGGLVAARFTDRAGASRFFHAGIVAYSDAAKQELLDVPGGTLAAHGAVSESVAAAMARGARRTADVAIAITGVAGPGGGSAEKPVGTVWIAVAIGDTMDVRRFVFDGDRHAIREAAVEAALEQLESVLGEAAWSAP